MNSLADLCLTTSGSFQFCKALNDTQRVSLFAPIVQNISVPHSKERFLAPGEQITLWVELELPDTIQYDIFQVLRDPFHQPLELQAVSAL